MQNKRQTEAKHSRSCTVSLTEGGENKKKRKREKEKKKKAAMETAFGSLNNNIILLLVNYSCSFLFLIIISHKRNRDFHNENWRRRVGGERDGELYRPGNIYIFINLKLLRGSAA